MRSVIVVLVALLVVGCGKDGPTEPEIPFSLALAGSVRQVGWNEQTQPRRYECRYTLTARALGGRASDVATWLESEWQFRYEDGTSWTYGMDLVEVLDYWGSNTIRSGETQEANRVAWGYKRFNLAYTFRFQEPDGRVRSEFLHVNCY